MGGTWRQKDAGLAARAAGPADSNATRWVACGSASTACDRGRPADGAREAARSGQLRRRGQVASRRAKQSDRRLATHRTASGQEDCHHCCHSRQQQPSPTWTATDTPSQRAGNGTAAAAATAARQRPTRTRGHDPTRGRSLSIPTPIPPSSVSRLAGPAPLRCGRAPIGPMRDSHPASFTAPPQPPL